MLPLADDSNKIRRALMFMVAASALVAMTTLIAKFLGSPVEGDPNIHPFQQSAGRYVFALLTILIAVAVAAFSPKTKLRLTKVHWGWHVVRSCLGSLGITCIFAAASRMPVADATAISFLNPIVTLALAAAMLGESVTLKKWLAAILALIGAMIILRPGTEAFQPAGLLALAAALFTGVEAIFVKKLARVEATLQILLVNNAIASVAMLIMAAIFWANPAPMQWLGLVGLGVIMVTAQAFFLGSLKLADVSLVMPVFYSVLIFVTLYDLVLYREWPSAFAILGSGLIVSGALLLVPRRKKPKNNGSFG